MKSLLEWLVCIDFLFIFLLLLFIAWQDILLRIISNKNLFILLCLSAILMAIQLQYPNVAAALAIIVIFFPLFICNVIGGGDIKLMSVLSLSLSWQQVIDFFFITAFLGGGVGIIGLIFFRHATRNSGIPYGVAISLSYIFIHTLLS